jgi:ribonuclease Z
VSDSLTITLLGTGSPLPDPNRAGPSTLVRGDGVTLLVDAGRGVVTRLSASGVFPPMLDAVLITHLHSDHICDLNDVVTTRWVMSPSPNPLTIIGPVGLAAVVEGLLAMLVPDIGYRLTHHDDLNEPPAVSVLEVAPGDTVQIGNATITVGATDHRPVAPTIGFRVTKGEVSVVVAGDGVPCEGLDELVRGADAYVQTVVRDDLVRQVPMPRFLDILDYHSTVAQAAETAERGGVGTLVLTHYVPAPPLGDYAEWIAQASPFSGQIVAGDDLTSVTVGGG